MKITNKIVLVAGDVVRLPSEETLIIKAVYREPDGRCYKVQFVEDDGEEWAYEGFDAIVYRDRILSCLADTLGYKEKLEKIYGLFNIPEISDSAFKKTLEKLEYLDRSHKELFLNGSFKELTPDREKYLERALAYFVYRHCTEVEDYNGFRASLGFCLFCQRLIASIDGDIFEAARIVSEEIEYSEDNTEKIKKNRT